MAGPSVLVPFLALLVIASVIETVRSATTTSCPEADPEPTPWSYEQVCSTATEHHWHLPYPGDCRRFIKCGIVDKYVTGFKCCDPLLFNPKIQVCDWPENVASAGGCSTSPTPTTVRPTPPPTTTTQEPTTTTPRPATTDKPTEAPTNDPGSGSSTASSCPEAKPEPTPWTYNEVCSTATEHHWHLPYPGDCRRFLKCGIVDKKVTGFKCCDPLLFNPAIQVCDWPGNVNCSTTVPNPEPTPEPTTTTPEPTTTTPEPTTTTPEPTTTTPEPTTTTPEPTTTTPEPTTTTPELTTTTPELTTTTPEPTTTTPEPTTTTQEPTTTTPRPATTAKPTTTNDPGSGSSTASSCPEAKPEPTPWTYNEVCSTATEHHWHLPYPGDCRRFLKCGIVDKKVTGFKCCDPLLFNPAIQVCDWPGNVNCSTTVPNPEPTPEPTQKPTPEPTTTTPRPATTAKPTEAPTNDPGSGSSTASSCPEAKPEPTPWTYNEVCSTATEHHWHLPYPGDCRRFLKCGIVDKKVTGFKCCDPLLFNPAIQVCDWPGNVNCSTTVPNPEPTPEPTTTTPEPTTTTPEPTTTTPEPTTTTPEPTTTTPEPTTTTPEPTTTTPEPTTTTPRPVTTAKPTTTNDPGSGSSTASSCPEAKPEPTPWTYNEVCSTATEHHWHLPYPGDCRRFLKCGIVDKKVTGFKCCDPLLFNPAIQVCDWPENVDCSDGGSNPNPVPSTSIPVTSKPSLTTSGSGGGGSTGNDCPYPYGPNNVCGSATLDRWLVADPANKAKFYSCDILSCRAFNMDCALYTHFNEAIQRCDWPDNVPQ